MNKSRTKSSPNNSGEKSTKSSRPLMFAASSVWVALILVIGVFRGGVSAPIEPRPVPPVPSLAQQADEMAALGDYARAAEKYRAAVEREPDDISLRFALGTALSHAGRQEETAEQFRWVVDRGDPVSWEAQTARRWLVRAGVLAERVTFVSSATTIAGAVPAGKVRGKTEWKGAEPQSGSGRVSIALRGEGESNKDVRLDTSVTLGEPYEFDQVPPGNYRLTARVSETTVWGRKVTVEPGGEAVLDLTDGGSAVASNEPPAPTTEETKR